MSNSENPAQLTEGSPDSRPKKPKQVETKLVPMSGISGIMQRVKRKTKALVLGAAISSAAGYGAAEYAQAKYREKMDYHPDRQAQVEPKSEPSPESTSAPEKKTPQNWLDRAKQLGSEKIDEYTDRVETIKKYKEMARQLQDIQRQYQEFKNKALQTGEQITYWLAFVLTFILMAKLLNRISKLMHPVDPVVEENLKIMMSAINRLERQASQNQHNPAELKKLAGQAEELLPGLQGLESKTLSRQ